MKLKLLIGALVFLIIVNLATIGSFLFFQWRHDGRPGGGSEQMRRLRMAPEKRERLRAMLGEFHDKTMSLRQEVTEKERALFDMLMVDKPDDVKINQAIDELTQLRSEITKMTVEKLLTAKTFLSEEEQRRFFNAMLRARPGPSGMRGQRNPHFQGNRRPPFERDKDKNKQSQTD